jgi:predicted aldo/keto reductase-like oxidoreductase
LEQVLAPGGALEALQEAKAQGKIGHIGITLHSVDLFKQAVEFDWVETIMFPYNIVETQAQELIAACKEKNIGFICMKPLAGGALDDGKIAMRFLAQNDNISIIIPGMASTEELQQNVAAYADKSPLTQAEQDQIATIRQQLGSDFCRRCNYCAPCTAGINIYSVLLFEGYYTRYNLHEWASDRYNALGKYASECIGCGVCETRCPYGLPIREKMQKAAKIFGK